ncbi:MAG TPA: hypothetical protein VMS71_04965, partial [Candidatus Acidoferrum sp.]|nr:hypothetical protein [Candidatus Acidoferrum sp.]
ADGQLARLSGIKSKMGRIFDGLAGNIVFASIYVHICLRFMAEGGSGWIFALAAVAGVCHSFQSALADYYRNGYLHFVRGPKSGELDSSAGILDEYHRLSWSRNFREKAMLRFYLEHIREQEMVSRKFLELKTVVAARYGDAIPKHIRDNYRTASRPMIKYYNILTINTRIIALILFLLIGLPYLYFVFELVVLNLLFVYVIIRQERISLSMLASLEGSTEA